MRLLIITAALCAIALPAIADDHMIRPQCWEENKGDHVERHCSVNGADPAVRTPAPRPSSPPAPIAAPPPDMEAPVGPDLQERREQWLRRSRTQPIPVNPCAPYACGYGHPSPRFYPPPYYGPPAFVFGFGPFSIVIP
jgi:hypothetical protein